MADVFCRQSGIARAFLAGTLALGALPAQGGEATNSTPAPTTSIADAYRLAEEGKAAKDPAKQFYWMKFAAEHKDPQAENELGYLYFKGIGVAADEEEAFGWFLKAAQDGNAMGEYNLGVMYENGRGIGRRDLNAAQVWFQAAADDQYEPAVQALKEIANLNAKAEAAAEQTQKADAIKTLIIGAGVLWLTSKLFSPSDDFSGTSGSSPTWSWEGLPTNLSLPNPSRSDTSIGCAWGDRASGTCH